MHTCTLTRLQERAAGQLAGVPSPPALHHPPLSPPPDPCPPPTGGRAQSLALELEGRRRRGLGQLLQASGGIHPEMRLGLGQIHGGSGGHERDGG